MGMIDTIAARMGYEKRNASTDPSWTAIAPGVGYFAGMTGRNAENLSTVLACTNLIGDSLGSIPALVYRREGDNRVEAPAHPLAKLVRQGVNPDMSWPDFMAHMMASTLLTGNGLAEIIRGGNGQLAGLRYIPWGMVTVSELSSGRLAYDVSDARGNMRRLLTGEILHLRDRTNDGKIGVSRLSRAGEALDAVNAANTHARTFLSNGASPSGTLEIPGTIKPEEKAAFQSSWAANQAGARNAGKLLILDGGMQFKPVQMSPEDAELLETRKFGVEEICRIYQVPPPLVQDYSHNTFTNSETAGRWFAMFTLAPWARKIEAEFARSLFPSNGAYELELDLSGFLRGDPQTRWNAHKIAIDAGVLDPDEIRQLEGWNPRTADGGKAPAPETDKEVT